MNNLKVGDRVRVIGNKYSTHFADVGDTGTIKGYHCRGKCIVEFDEPSRDFHSCAGAVRRYHGQWIDERDLEPIERSNWKIVIIANGDETTARFYEHGKARSGATVRRYREDAYDTFTAAEEAIKKLFGKQVKPEPEKPKGFTGKAVCTHSLASGFTRGKIYEFCDGRFTNDFGVVFPPDKKLDARMANKWFDAYFVKILPDSEDR